MIFAVDVLDCEYAGDDACARYASIICADEIDTISSGEDILRVMKVRFGQISDGWFDLPFSCVRRLQSSTGVDVGPIQRLVIAPNEVARLNSPGARSLSPRIPTPGGTMRG